MVICAFGELATIGAVLPFLTLLTDSAGWERFPWLAGLLDQFGASTPQDRLLAVTSLFVAFAIISAMLRLQLLWSSQGFVFKLGHDISVEIQRRILLQPYSFHIQKNTSALIAALDKVHALVWNLLLPLMQTAAAVFISIFITATLIYVDPFTASVAAAVFTVTYLLISAFTRQRLARNSAVVGAAYDERVKIVQESLGGIRDVIIDSAQPVFLDSFRRVDRRLNVARATTVFIGTAPRFVIEAFGMVLIALLANLLARDGGVASAIPILGALALGAQRLLPLLQQIYSGWASVTGNSSIISQVVDLLSLPVPTEAAYYSTIEPLPLRESIRFDHVSFAYSGRRVHALDDVTFEVPRGSTIGLIGKTGSGKSTFADLLMGLLEPTKGRITVDGVTITGEARQRWWSSIAHVPQAIFLADDTIARNIAFGAPVDAVDMDRVVEAAAAAQMHEFISSLPDGYHSEVGERGIRLSGGQRQRLGLARAIYKKAPVLILDEATSALDDETEAAVMESLRHLGEQGRSTIVMIAHRLTTMAQCDMIARVVDGRITELGSYEQVVRSRVRQRSTR